MSKEKIGADLRKHIENEIKYSAKHHLESWAKRYAGYKTVSSVRFDLKMNHDNSLEFEHAEESLGRKLNDKERELLTERFNIEVCKQANKYINRMRF